MSDIGRSLHFRSAHRFLIFFALAALGLAGACGPAAMAGVRTVPVSTARTKVHLTVEEYPMVEQSSDNPTHAQFIEHLPPAVTARRADWRSAKPEDAIHLPNQALNLFDYRLAMNPHVPFRAYALYQGEQLVQANILHFWPVTLNAAGDDFLLPFETLAGDRLVASRSGLSGWPGIDSQETSPPVFIGDRLAFAAIDNSQVSVQAGGQVLYSLPELTPSVPGRLVSWSGHWALETDGNVIVDGQSLNESLQSERIFQWQTIHAEPFFFYTKNGLTRMNYAGRSLPYIYDQVITGDTPETALFRPGGNEHMVWFFALRDGLWYYVEAGVFEE